MARKGTETGGSAETKAAKFSRLASARVTRAVKAINRVGALASAQYEKTPAQVDKIDSYLNAAVRAAVARLRGEARPTPTSKFNLTLHQGNATVSRSSFAAMSVESARSETSSSRQLFVFRSLARLQGQPNS